MDHLFCGKTFPPLDCFDWTGLACFPDSSLHQDFSRILGENKKKKKEKKKANTGLPEDQALFNFLNSVVLPNQNRVAADGLCLGRRGLGT